MVPELVRKDDITSETLARILNDDGIRASAPVPGVDLVMVPGPGIMGIAEFAGRPHLTFGCVFRFQLPLDLEDRQALANQMMRLAPGFRSYLNDEEKLVCKFDLMVEGGLLPSQLIYSYKTFRLAMERLVEACEGALS